MDGGRQLTGTKKLSSDEKRFIFRGRFPPVILLMCRLNPAGLEPNAVGTAVGQGGRQALRV